MKDQKSWLRLPRVLLLCFCQCILSQPVRLLQVCCPSSGACPPSGAELTLLLGGCLLSSEEIPSVLDFDSRTWNVNDSALQRHGLQPIVDCALANDTIRLRAEGIIRPEATIRIERSVSIEGMSRKATRITCPSDQPLFGISEVADVALRNFSISGCSLAEQTSVESIIVVGGSCSSTESGQRGSLEVTGVSIEKNANDRGGVAPHFDDPSCFSLTLERVDFVSNEIGGPASLASINYFRDVAARGNVVKKGGRDFLFDLPDESSFAASRVSVVDNVGPALRARGSTFTLSDSNFSFNRITEGRLFQLESSSVTVNSTRFESNSCGTADECVLISGGAAADLHSVFFLSNSMRATLLKINNRGYTSLTSCVFESNKAVESAASGTMFHFLFDSDFEAHSLIIDDLAVRNNSSPFSVFNVDSSDGTEVKIRNSSFERNRGLYEGVMHISAAGRVDVSGANFTENESRYYGGAYFDACGNVSIDASTFVRNNAEGSDASTLIGNGGGGFGGGLALKDCGLARVSNSIFVENSAFGGGGCFVGADLAPVGASFLNCLFANNTAESIGGGIAIVKLYDVFLKPMQVSIEETSIEFNHARVAGGGIFTSDEGHLTIDCEFEDLGGGNTAATDVFDAETTYVGCRRLKGNTVGDRGAGRDIAGAAQDYYIFLIERAPFGYDQEDSAAAVEREYYQLQRREGEADLWILEAGSRLGAERSRSNRITLGETLVIENWRPGDLLPAFEVLPVDQYGQTPAPLVHIAAFDVLTASLEVEPVTDESSGRVILQRGIPIHSLGPGILETVDYSAPPGKCSFALSVAKGISWTTQVNVTFRECIINEEFPGGNFCKDCPASTYNFDPTDAAATCRECPENLDCSTEFVFPEAGYWTSFPCSVKAQRCINADACSYQLNGGSIDFSGKRDCNFSETEIELYWEDQCIEGHAGKLCGECREGYGYAGAYTCAACRSPVLAVAFSLVALGIVFGISYLQIGSCIELKEVAATLFRARSLLKNVGPGQSAVSQSASSNQTNSSGASSSACSTTNGDLNAERIRAKIRFAEILKSGVNFFQTVTAAASMDVSWAETLKGMFKVQSEQSALTVDALMALAAGWIGGDPVEATSFSTECLLSTDKKTIARQVVVTVLPLAIILIQSSFFLKSFASKQIDGGTFLRRCALVLVVVFYVCYVSLARTAFAILYCVNITLSFSLSDDAASTKFWAIDTSKECFTGPHLVLALTVALPLLVFVSCFPIFVTAITVAIRSRKKLGCASILDTFGILYRGFNEETVYWDSLILLRKALIIAILTFGYNVGGSLQGLSCICILVIALYLQTVFRPFRTELGNLNSIESLSLLISILTFVGGVAIQDLRLQSTTIDYILISLIVGGNVGFALLVGHQLYQSKAEELKFSLLDAGIDVEDRSSLFVFKAWTIASATSAIEAAVCYIKSIIEMLSIKGEDAPQEDDSAPSSP